MKLSKLYLLASYCLLFSCSQKTTTVYFHNASKIDDGDIFGEQLSAFFLPDKNIHIYKLKSNDLNDELAKIKDSLSFVPSTDEPDDGYYQYAFITAQKDTLYSQNLEYWKHNRKGMRYTADKIQPIIENLLSPATK